MPNEFKQQSPQLHAYKTQLKAQGEDLTLVPDSELIRRLGELARSKGVDLAKYPTFRNEYLDVVNAPGEDMRGPTGYAREFGKGLAMSGLGLVSSGFDFAAMPFAQEPTMGVHDWLTGVASSLRDQASKYKPTITSPTDVRWGFDRLDESIRGAMSVSGQAGASLLESLVAGKTFSSLSKNVSKIVTKDIPKDKMILRRMPDGKMRSVNQRQWIEQQWALNGMFAGTALNSVGMNAGEIYGSLLPYTELDENHEDYVPLEDARAAALMGGAVSGSMDSILPSMVLKNFITKTGNPGSQYWWRFVRSLPKNMVIEGGTEYAQEFVNLMAEKYAKGEEMTWQALSHEEKKMLIDAGILGAVGGMQASLIEGFHNPADETINESALASVEAEVQEDIERLERGEQYHEEQSRPTPQRFQIGATYQLAGQNETATYIKPLKDGQSEVRLDTGVLISVANHVLMPYDKKSVYGGLEIGDYVSYEDNGMILNGQIKNIKDGKAYLNAGSIGANIGIPVESINLESTKVEYEGSQAISSIREMKSPSLSKSNAKKILDANGFTGAIYVDEDNAIYTQEAIAQLSRALGAETDTHLISYKNGEVTFKSRKKEEIERLRKEEEDKHNDLMNYVYNSIMEVHNDDNGTSQDAINKITSILDESGIVKSPEIKRFNDRLVKYIKGYNHELDKDEINNIDILLSNMKFKGNANAEKYNTKIKSMLKSWKEPKDYQLLKDANGGLWRFTGNRASNGGFEFLKIGGKNKVTTALFSEGFNVTPVAVSELAYMETEILKSISYLRPGFVNDKYMPYIEEAKRLTGRTEGESTKSSARTKKAKNTDDPTDATLNIPRPNEKPAGKKSAKAPAQTEQVSEDQVSEAQVSEDQVSEAQVSEDQVSEEGAKAPAQTEQVSEAQGLLDLLKSTDLSAIKSEDVERAKEGFQVDSSITYGVFDSKKLNENANFLSSVATGKDTILSMAASLRSYIPDATFRQLMNLMRIPGIGEIPVIFAHHDVFVKEFPPQNGGIRRAVFLPKSRQIVISTAYSTTENIAKDLAEVITHEAAHPVYNTARKIANGEVAVHEYVAKETAKAIRSFEANYAAAVRSGKIEGYGLTSVDEFFTEFISNPEFSGQMKGVELNGGVTIWEWIRNFIAKIINAIANFGSQIDLYSQVQADVGTILDNVRYSSIQDLASDDFVLGSEIKAPTDKDAIVAIAARIDKIMEQDPDVSDHEMRNKVLASLDTRIRKVVDLKYDNYYEAARIIMAQHANLFKNQPPSYDIRIRKHTDEEIDNVFDDIFEQLIENKWDGTDGDGTLLEDENTGQEYFSYEYLPKLRFSDPVSHWYYNEFIRKGVFKSIKEATYDLEENTVREYVLDSIEQVRETVREQMNSGRLVINAREHENLARGVDLSGMSPHLRSSSVSKGSFIKDIVSRMNELPQFSPIGSFVSDSAFRSNYVAWDTVSGDTVKVSINVSNQRFSDIIDRQKRLNGGTDEEIVRSIKEATNKARNSLRRNAQYKELVESINAIEHDIQSHEAGEIKLGSIYDSYVERRNEMKAQLSGMGGGLLTPKQIKDAYEKDSVLGAGSMIVVEQSSSVSEISNEINALRRIAELATGENAQHAKRVLAMYESESSSMIDMMESLKMLREPKIERPVLEYGQQGTEQFNTSLIYDTLFSTRMQEATKFHARKVGQGETADRHGTNRSKQTTYAAFVNEQTGVVAVLGVYPGKSEYVMGAKKLSRPKLTDAGYQMLRDRREERTYYLGINEDTGSPMYISGNSLIELTKDQYVEGEFEDKLFMRPMISGEMKVDMESQFGVFFDHVNGKDVNYLRLAPELKQNSGQRIPNGYVFSGMAKNDVIYRKVDKSGKVQEHRIAKAYFKRGSDDTLDMLPVENKYHKELLNTYKKSTAIMVRYPEMLGISGKRDSRQSGGSSGARVSQIMTDKNNPWKYTGDIIEFTKPPMRDSLVAEGGRPQYYHFSSMNEFRAAKAQIGTNTYSSTGSKKKAMTTGNLKGLHTLYEDNFINLSRDILANATQDDKIAAVRHEGDLQETAEGIFNHWRKLLMASNDHNWLIGGGTERNHVDVMNLVGETLSGLDQGVVNADGNLILPLFSSGVDKYLKKASIDRLNRLQKVIEAHSSSTTSVDFAGTKYDKKQFFDSLKSISQLSVEETLLMQKINTLSNIERSLKEDGVDRRNNTYKLVHEARTSYQNELKKTAEEKAGKILENELLTELEEQTGIGYVFEHAVKLLRMSDGGIRQSRNEGKRAIVQYIFESRFGPIRRYMSTGFEPSINQWLIYDKHPIVVEFLRKDTEEYNELQHKLQIGSHEDSDGSLDIFENYASPVPETTRESIEFEVNFNNRGDTIQSVAKQLYPSSINPVFDFIDDNRVNLFLENGVSLDAYDSIRARRSIGDNIPTVEEEKKMLDSLNRNIRAIKSKLTVRLVKEVTGEDIRIAYKPDAEVSFGGNKVSIDLMSLSELQLADREASGELIKQVKITTTADAQNLYEAGLIQERFSRIVQKNDHTSATYADDQLYEEGAIEHASPIQLATYQEAWSERQHIPSVKGTEANELAKSLRKSLKEELKDIDRAIENLTEVAHQYGEEIRNARDFIQNELRHEIIDVDGLEYTAADLMDDGYEHERETYDENGNLLPPEQQIARQKARKAAAKEAMSELRKSNKELARLIYKTNRSTRMKRLTLYPLRSYVAKREVYRVIQDNLGSLKYKTPRGSLVSMLHGDTLETVLLPKETHPWISEELQDNPKGVEAALEPAIKELVDQLSPVGKYYKAMVSANPIHALQQGIPTRNGYVKILREVQPNTDDAVIKNAAKVFHEKDMLLMSGTTQETLDLSKEQDPYKVGLTEYINAAIDLERSFDQDNTYESKVWTKWMISDTLYNQWERHFNPNLKYEDGGVRRDRSTPTQRSIGNPFDAMGPSDIVDVMDKVYDLSRIAISDTFSKASGMSNQEVNSWKKAFGSSNGNLSNRSAFLKKVGGISNREDEIFTSNIRQRVAERKQQIEVVPSEQIDPAVYALQKKVHDLKVALHDLESEEASHKGIIRQSKEDIKRLETSKEPTYRHSIHQMEHIRNREFVKAYRGGYVDLLRRISPNFMDYIAPNQEVNPTYGLLMKWTQKTLYEYGFPTFEEYVNQMTQDSDNKPDPILFSFGRHSIDELLALKEKAEKRFNDLDKAYGVKKSVNPGQDPGSVIPDDVVRKYESEREAWIEALRNYNQSKTAHEKAGKEFTEIEPAEPADPRDLYRIAYETKAATAHEWITAENRRSDNLRHIAASEKELKEIPAKIAEANIAYQSHKAQLDMLGQPEISIVDERRKYVKSPKVERQEEVWRDDPERLSKLRSEAELIKTLEAIAGNSKGLDLISNMFMGAIENRDNPGIALSNPEYIRHILDTKFGIPIGETDAKVFLGEGIKTVISNIEGDPFHPLNQKIEKPEWLKLEQAKDIELVVDHFSTVDELVEAAYKKSAEVFSDTVMVASGHLGDIDIDNLQRWMSGDYQKAADVDGIDGQPQDPNPITEYTYSMIRSSAGQHLSVAPVEGYFDPYEGRYWDDYVLSDTPEGIEHNTLMATKDLVPKMRRMAELPPEVLQANMAAIEEFTGGGVYDFSAGAAIRRLLEGEGISQSEKDILGLIQKLPVLKDVRIVFEDQATFRHRINDLPDGHYAQAMYDESTRTIYMTNTFSATGENAYSDLARIMTHEILHPVVRNAIAITKNGLKLDRKATGLSGPEADRLDALIGDIETLYNEIQGKAKSGMYVHGLVSLDEFVVEFMTNPKFQNMLKGITLSNNAKRNSASWVQSAWDWIKDLIGRIVSSFSRSPVEKRSAYERMTELTDEMMDTYSNLTQDASRSQLDESTSNRQHFSVTMDDQVEFIRKSEMAGVQDVMRQMSGKMQDLLDAGHKFGEDPKQFLESNLPGFRNLVKAHRNLAGLIPAHMLPGLSITGSNQIFKLRASQTALKYVENIAKNARERISEISTSLERTSGDIKRAKAVLEMNNKFDLSEHSRMLHGQLLNMIHNARVRAEMSPERGNNAAKAKRLQDLEQNFTPHKLQDILNLLTEGHDFSNILRESRGVKDSLKKLNDNDIQQDLKQEEFLVDYLSKVISRNRVNMVYYGVARAGMQQAFESSTNEYANWSLVRIEYELNNLGEKTDQETQARKLLLKQWAYVRMKEESQAPKAKQLDVFKAFSEGLMNYRTKLRFVLGEAEPFNPADDTTMLHMSKDSNGEWVSDRFLLKLSNRMLPAERDEFERVISNNKKFLKYVSELDPVEAGKIKAQPFYDIVKNQTEAAAHLPLQKEHFEARTAWMLSAIQSLGHRMSKLGVAGKTVSQMIHKTLAMHKQYLSAFMASSHKWQRAVREMMSHTEVKDTEKFLDGIYSQAIYWIENRPHLTWREAVDGAWDYITKHGVVEDRNFSSGAKEAFVNLMMETDRHRKLEAALHRKLGGKVEESYGKSENSLMIESMITPGKMVPLHRNPIDQGAITLSRRAHSTVISDAVEALERANWNRIDNTEPWMTRINKLITLDVIDKFIAPHFTMEAVVEVYHTSDGIRIKQSDIQDAWHGTIGYDGPERFVKFIDNLSQLVGEEHDALATSILSQLSEQYRTIKKIAVDANEKSGSSIEIKHSTQHKLLDARNIEKPLPREYYRYESFDEVSTRIHLATIIAHSVFGRGGEGLKALRVKLSRDLDAKSKQFESLIQDAGGKYDRQSRKPGPWYYGKIRRRAEEILVDRHGVPSDQRKKRFEELHAAAMQRDRISHSLDQLDKYYGGKDGPYQDVRFLTELMGFKAFLMLSQPGSSLLNFLSINDIWVFSRGLNMMGAKATATAAGNAIKQAFGGMMESMGVQMERNTEYAQDLNEMFFQFEENELPFSDFINQMGLRGGGKRSLYEKTLTGGLTGGLGAWLPDSIKKIPKAARYAPSGVDNPNYHPISFKSLIDVFGVASRIANHSIAVGMANLYHDTVKRAADYIEANGLRGKSIELTAKQLKYGSGLGELGIGKVTLDRALFGAEAGWNNANEKAIDAGLGSITQMAQEYLDRKDRGDDRVLTKDQVLSIGQIGLNEVTLDGFGARAPVFYTNGLGRVASPLLGWSVAKMDQVAEFMRDSDGRINAIMMAKYLALVGMAITPVGLAFSLMRDMWDDEILNQPNSMPSIAPTQLIPLMGFVDTGHEDFSIAGAFQRLSRTASPGGLVFDSIVQMAGAADPNSPQRSVSVDQRVLGLATMHNLMDIATTFVTQDWKGDYATMGRPLIYAFGGNSVMHYHKALTNLMGINSTERVMSDMTGIKNEMRAAAKAAGLPLKAAWKGDIVSSEARMHEKAMERAIYKNDHEAFMDAYVKAVAATRKKLMENGNFETTAEKVILGKIKNMNPMFKITSHRPTDDQKYEILKRMSDDGQRKLARWQMNLNYYESLLSP